MLPVTICHFIKDYQHRKKIRCAAVTESQCLCLSDRTGRYALHTLLSILSHHMVPLRIIAICISEMSYISQTERIKCRVEGCPFRSTPNHQPWAGVSQVQSASSCPPVRAAAGSGRESLWERLGGVSTSGLESQAGRHAGHYHHWWRGLSSRYQTDNNPGIGGNSQVNQCQCRGVSSWTAIRPADQWGTKVIVTLQASNLS